MLDVAHNPHGIDFLCRELKLRDWHSQVDCVVLGMLEDKEHATVAAQLHEFFACPIVLVDTFGERAFSAEQLADAITAEKTDLPLEIASSRSDAIARAESATAVGNVILALGSFSVVEHFSLTGDKEVTKSQEQ